LPVIATGVGHVHRRGEPEEARALDHIDIVIERGEFVLIAGAMGSGKTTLLQSLCGLQRPFEGRVTIDGIEVSKARGAAAMAIQFPERALFADTVLEDVAFGPTNMGMRKEDARQRAIESAGAVGLEEALLARKPSELSHGQRRLAALAGVIAVKPRYLFLDEPTAGLDPRVRSRVVQALVDLNRAGMAIIVASHDLEHFLSICGRLIVLDRGRIMVDGQPDELVSLEDIESLGLALPPSIAAARWLSRRGVAVRWNVSPEELAEHLRRLEHEGARQG
jgi:energy-coupling factor transporter ATP-binding protein EcfA2